MRKKHPPLRTAMKISEKTMRTKIPVQFKILLFLLDIALRLPISCNSSALLLRISAMLLRLCFGEELGASSPVGDKNASASPKFFSKKESVRGVRTADPPAGFMRLALVLFLLDALLSRRLPGGIANGGCLNIGGGGPIGLTPQGGGNGGGGKPPDLGGNGGGGKPPALGGNGGGGGSIYSISITSPSALVAPSSWCDSSQYSLLNSSSITGFCREDSPASLSRYLPFSAFSGLFEED